MKRKEKLERVKVRRKNTVKREEGEGGREEWREVEGRWEREGKLERAEMRRKGDAEG